MLALWSEVMEEQSIWIKVNCQLVFASDAGVCGGVWGGL